jgi:hypothetical protein
MQDNVTVEWLAQHFNLSVWATRSAFRSAGTQCGKGRGARILYPLDAAAKVISPDFTVAQLAELVSLAEAEQLMAARGHSRSRRQLNTWRTNGRGPRPFYVGKKSIFYLKSDVLATCDALDLIRQVFRKPGPKPAATESAAA